MENNICVECETIVINGICYHCTPIACTQCGNNKECTGECFDCEIRPNMVYKECGICYESKYDKGFTHGFHCDHEVCGDCTRRITRCPFCRQPWKEDEPAEPEREYTITEIFGEDSDDEDEDEDSDETPIHIPPEERRILRIFNCPNCRADFDYGRDRCRGCDADLNIWNTTEEDEEEE